MKSLRGCTLFSSDLLDQVIVSAYTQSRNIFVIIVSRYNTQGSELVSC